MERLITCTYYALLLLSSTQIEGHTAVDHPAVDLSVADFSVVDHSVIDFHQSMRVLAYPEALSIAFSQEVYGRALQLYQRYAPERVAAQEEAFIPKVIHHIWFGVPLSEEDKALRATWEQQHPAWRFVLWTDRVSNDARGVVATSWQEVHKLLAQADVRFITVDVSALAFGNRTFFDQARNYGEKSDILKWEIIYRLGGVYIDCDFECLKPLDDLHHRYAFYTGLQPLDTQVVQLGAALFAAQPQHPILAHAVQTIEDDRHHKQIVIRTGPIHFTNSFVAMAGKEYVDVALPASYFYPMAYEQAKTARHEWQCPESYAVHHWAGSWLKPEAFIR